MESWRHVWREGFAPILSTAELLALREGLREDDPHLLQGKTTDPFPLMSLSDLPVEGACLLGYCGWKGDELTNVGEVEKFFADKCFFADERLGEVSACRHLLNYWDDEPRDVVRKNLLEEVELSIAARKAGVP